MHRSCSEAAFKTSGTLSTSQVILAAEKYSDNSNPVIVRTLLAFALTSSLATKAAPLAHCQTMALYKGFKEDLLHLDR